MQQITPQTTIIVFDINGVLFTTDYWQLFTLLIRDKNSFRLLVHVLHPYVVRDIIRLYWKGSTNEEYYAHLVSTYSSLAPCKSLLLAAAQAQKPIPSMIELVEQLRTLGYQLHILSNIGMIFFSHLQALHPTFFAHFRAFKIANLDENYLSKPHKLMYERYQKECNPEHKQVIFIDDKKRNVYAAQQEGMIGVLFNNPQQCRKALLALIPGL